MMEKQTMQTWKKKPLQEVHLYVSIILWSLIFSVFEPWDSYKKNFYKKTQCNLDYVSTFSDFVDLL